MGEARRRRRLPSAQLTFMPCAVLFSVPVNAPGLVARALPMLARGDGPLGVRWTPHLLRMAPWALGFARHCEAGRVERSALALGTLLRRAADGYDGVFAQAGVDVDGPMGEHAAGGADPALAFAARRGYLLLQPTAAAMAASEAGAQLRRAGLGEGLRMEAVDAAAVRELEPHLDVDRHAGGGAWWFPDGWFLRQPAALLRALRRGFLAAGGAEVRGEAVGFAGGAGAGVGVRTVRTHGTADGDDPSPRGEETVWADVAVVAAGAHSAALVRAAGDWVPLDTERGHSVEWAPGTEAVLGRAVCTAVGGFIMTPMADGLRAAGLVELGGTAAGLTKARCDQLDRETRSLLGGAAGGAAGGLGPRDEARDWLGFRPTLPDALPVIGRSPRSPHVLYAFGHQHVGWTLGGITGRLVAELATRREPSVDLAPFRVDRFSRWGWAL